MDTALLVAIAALCGADIALTSACVADGRCVEANPLWRAMSDHPTAFGAVKAGVTAGAVVGVWRATRGRPKARIAALLGIVGLQAIVVGVNYSRLH